MGAEQAFSVFAKAGVTYTRRRLDDGLATLADDGTGGFLIINPGAGLAASLPREADGARTQWVHTLDAQLSARYSTAGRQLVTMSIDAFNVLNAQAALRKETLLPLQNQAPRQLRLGLRYAF